MAAIVATEELLEPAVLGAALTEDMALLVLMLLQIQAVVAEVQVKELQRAVTAAQVWSS